MTICKYCRKEIVRLNKGRKGTVWVHKRKGYLTAPDLADRLNCHKKFRAEPEEEIK